MLDIEHVGMGLDIIAGDFPKEAKKPTDIPRDWVPRVIGKTDVLAVRIKSAIPIAKFKSPRSGLIMGDDFALEIDLGKENECKYVHFTARGNENSIGAVLNILQLLEIRAIECASSGFLDLGPESDEALRKWREYLARLVP